MKKKLKEIKKGQWIFTCSMQPKQFDHYEERNPEDYTKGNFTDEQWEDFLKYDNFVTLEGSWHSRRNCGLKLISEAYALFFIENELWNLFFQSDEDQCWVKYEERLRRVCDEFDMKYEGF